MPSLFSVLLAVAFPTCAIDSHRLSRTNVGKGIECKFIHLHMLEKSLELSIFGNILGGMGESFYSELL